ncbi:MAG: response regulator [Deltaproteobacteria bacterium]|nr:response regulator [Deltaproteobacteria bacterium]
MSNRVLFVESDEILRSSVIRALRARGIGVDAFDTALSALEAVSSGTIWTRALIDLSLPDLDGATLAEQILQYLPEIELTFAAGSTEAAVLCRAHGLGTVLWKPFGLGPLCERFSSQSRGSGTFLSPTKRVAAASKTGTGR